MKRLNEIKQREMRATKGPWLQDPTGDVGDWYIGSEETPVCQTTCDCISKQQQSRNGQFIAHAREDIPFLIDLVSEAADIIRMYYNLTGTFRSKTWLEKVKK